MSTTEKELCQMEVHDKELNNELREILLDMKKHRGDPGLLCQDVKRLQGKYSIFMFVEHRVLETIVQIMQIHIGHEGLIDQFSDMLYFLALGTAKISPQFDVIFPTAKISPRGDAKLATAKIDLPAIDWVALDFGVEPTTLASLLVSLMERHLGNTKILQSAVSALFTLAEFGNRPLALTPSTAILPALLATMRHHADKTEIHTDAWRVMLRLVSNKGESSLYKATFEDPQHVDVLANSLKLIVGKKLSATLHDAMESINQIMGDRAGIQAAFLKDFGFGDLVSIVENNAFSPAAKYATMKCMSTFMDGQNDILNDAIIASGLIARFVCLFKSHANNDQIVTGIGLVFHEIPPTILPAAAKQIADEGGIAAMLSSIIHHHSNNITVQKLLFAVIWKLFTGDQESVKRACDSVYWIQAVTAFMKRHPSNKAVQAVAGSILSHFPTSNDYPEFKQSGALDTIVAAMKRFPDDIWLQNYATRAVDFLVTKGDQSDAAIWFASSGFIATLIPCLQRHRDDAHLQEQGIFLLVKMATGNEAFVEEISRGPDIVSFLASFQNDPATNPRLKEYVNYLLWDMAGCRDPNINSAAEAALSEAHDY